MVYAMVKEGHAIKLKGSTVWNAAIDAKAHLAALAQAKPDHWKAWTVRSLDADWEADTCPHIEFPDSPDKSWRSLTRDSVVVE